MRIWATSFTEGQHVIARRRLDGWPGAGVVRKGMRGVILKRPRGWFSDTYLVEFSNGRRIAMSGRHLKPALFGHGHGAWRRHQEVRQGIRLGFLLLFGVPSALALLEYYGGGGSTAGLIAALPQALLLGLLQILQLAGFPGIVLVLLGAWLWRALRR